MSGEEVAATHKAGENAAFDFAWKVMASSKHDRIRQLGIVAIEEDSLASFISSQKYFTLFKNDYRKMGTGSV